MTSDSSTWRLFGASVTGTSHLKAGTPCQDAHAHCLLAGDVALLVAADGAGSAERSDEGALAAVTSALEALANALTPGWPADEASWAEVFYAAYAQAQQDLEQMAQAAGLAPRAFAATLLCAAVSPRGLAVAQLGDGVVVAATAAGEWFLVAEPQRGEYANETYFLTQPQALDQVEIACYDGPVQALAVMTDGLLRLVMDLSRREPHAPFFQPLLAFAAEVGDAAEGQAQLEAFLASDRVCARTDDDKTLVLAARVAGNPSGP